MDRRILVVDDSELICQQLSQLLASPDRRIKVAHDGTTALEWIVERNFSLVITDLCLPGINGLDLIREIRQRDLPVTAIVMTGNASIDSAVAAMKLGAYDYLLKPIDALRLGVLVEQALEDRKLIDEVESLRHGVQQRCAYHDLLGKSPRMREVFSRVARVASSSCTVLITGETGTGKELVAQAIHYSDVTRREPLVAVNCAALPEPLLESEFFGHEKGAFTGADRQKKGRFEQAKGGTLLLDEIGELPLGMQAKLLRVLQDGTFERVGGSEVIQAECRVLAATNLNLAEAVAAGRFREDLFYRLNVVSIELPALRDRADDIPLLVQHILKRLQERRLPAKTLSRETYSRLARYDWPGNVRELEHVIEQAVVTTPGLVIEPDNLPPQVVSTREEPFSLDFDLHRPLQLITDELTERVERAYLQRVLSRYRGRIDRCAAHCGLSRRSISEKLRRYCIDKAEFKSKASLHQEVALVEPA
ncbi:DNA-binding transcriptional response regulator, NtrC family, contains REC, AAA-type ATPase, and a Fis-type DNA-binding domains [Singulisphaera sp. GP187]|uniref:sigma-54-dependent transcriptional regulator n=1 Tax=Singulisphaera sp. GP187 TaxID=1882752 RepID=UPI0009261F2E|nr:sigma-54 dependent transcriptional regulator [Singulisphaera sp. GP187]SIO64985.1 DNA-binding transcriptional response regulator, NtrC family, contains REC, AAA-type ATPase, and a Fis-type DNA-binding domains [Singulisphaera sp. GP187]